jgi:hypothetical protein
MGIMVLSACRSGERVRRTSFFIWVLNSLVVGWLVRLLVLLLFVVVVVESRLKRLKPVLMKQTVRASKTKASQVKGICLKINMLIPF